jgi:hypothetical protein
MAFNTSFTAAMKNYMLNQWRGQSNIAFRALQGTTVVSSTSASFNAASNGKITLASNATIVIPGNEEFTVNKIDLRVGTTTQAEWSLGASEVVFDVGGNLVITQCDLEITN